MSVPRGNHALISIDTPCSLSALFNKRNKVSQSLGQNMQTSKIPLMPAALSVWRHHLLFHHASPFAVKDSLRDSFEVIARGCCPSKLYPSQN